MTQYLSVLQYLLRLFGHSGVPYADSLLARLGVLGASRTQKFSIPWRGITYHGNLQHLIDRHIFYFGAYTPAELDFLERAASILRAQGVRDLTMLDIGANVGQHSLALHRFVDRVIAFEPSTRIAGRLKKNIRTNGITNIEVHEVALGNQDAAGQLGSGLPGNDGSRSLNWTLDASTNEAVPVRHGGRYLNGIEPRVDKVHLIKLDVEGHEKLVFAGIVQRLLDDRPVILFELIGDQGGGFRNEVELRSYLYPDHYLFALKGGRNGRLVPFTWGRDEEVVCLPAEKIESFESIGATDRL